MTALYYTPNSPYARKVRILLAEKGLEFKPELLPVAPSGSGRFFPASYEAMNPNKRIPLLVDGPRRLWESGLIQDYLFAAYPHSAEGNSPPLAPSLTRPGRHWEDLMILNTIDTMLDSGVNLFQFIRGGMQPGAVPYLRREMDRTQSELDWLEQEIGPEGFWPGAFCAMDINLICALGWLELRKPVPWRRPKLEAFMQRHASRPSVKESHPPG